VYAARVRALGGREVVEHRHPVDRPVVEQPLDAPAGRDADVVFDRIQARVDVLVAEFEIAERRVGRRAVRRLGRAEVDGGEAAGVVDHHLMPVAVRALGGGERVALLVEGQLGDEGDVLPEI
jgi:hypothetical protein